MKPQTSQSGPRSRQEGRGNSPDTLSRPEQEHLSREHSPIHAPIPGLGLRSIKTALATVLTALLYAFLPNSNPTFACIGAIFGMGADMEDSRRSGGNRFFGTIIGGFIGLGLYWLEHLLYPEGNYWLRLPLVSLGVVVMISVCVLFRWPGGVQPGGVVLCIILFNTPAHHIDYAISRMIDTGVGVVIALLVNCLLSRSRLEHWFRLDQAGNMLWNRHKRAVAPEDYDRENWKPVLKCSICNGERVAGFKNICTGEFKEECFVRDDRDLEAFMHKYGITEMPKEY